jgi:hypothetical protein
MVFTKSRTQDLKPKHMIVISEWIPNPKGSDTTGEWIEVQNRGLTPAALSGWRISADGKRSAGLGNETIGPGEYAVLSRSDTKIVLRNTNGSLELLDPSGKRAQEARFIGEAPEGKSVSRTDHGQFLFSAPSPGAENIFLEGSGLTDREYATGIPLRATASATDHVSIGGMAGVLMAGIALVIIKRNHALKELFFS